MRIFLAPMEGVVDYHLRKIFAAVGGIDFCVTEFIRITSHILPERVFTKYCPELLEENREFHIGRKAIKTIPVRVQLLGSDPVLLAQNAAKAAALGAIGIDLNFGCPAKGVNKNRGGACLLDETPLIYDIVHTVRAQVPAHIPVTAKIRLGYHDKSTFLDNARTIEDAGASELFVHARSKADGYNPPAYWPLIGKIRDALDIPVIANGEVWTLSDFKQCQTESSCSDFMLGRGLLANPGIAREIKKNKNQNKNSHLEWHEAVKCVHRLFVETSSAYPSKHLGNRVKQWLHYLQRHYPEAQTLFETIKRMRDYQEIDTAIRSAF